MSDVVAAEAAVAAAVGAMLYTSRRRSRATRCATRDRTPQPPLQKTKTKKKKRTSHRGDIASRHLPSPHSLDTMSHATGSSLVRIFLLAAAASTSLVVVAAAPKKELPSYIHVCKRSDTRLKECVLNSVEQLRPNLVSGIPEMDVPPMDPLLIPELVIAPSKNIRAVGKNVLVWGGSSFKINSLDIDFNDTALTFTAGIEIPLLTFASNYTVDGRILALPLRGNGPLAANATDIRGQMQLVGTITKRKSGEYLRFHEAEMKLSSIGDVKIHLGNLFNGDKTLGEATNAALNDNNEELRKAVIPTAERTVAKFAIDTANKIAINYPLEQLWPKE